jgi:transcriptional regulator with XRE-family HTH domain
MRLSERMVELRKQRGITQKQLALALGLSELAIQNYESERRRPAHEVMVDIAKYFNVSIDYLVGRTDNPNVNDGRIETRPEIITCPLTGMKQTVYLYILHYQGYVYTRSNGCDNAYNCPACHECCKNFLKIDPEEEINS